MKPVHVFLSNFTFELLGEKMCILVDNERKIANVLNFFVKMRKMIFFVEIICIQCFICNFGFVFAFIF